MASFTEMPKTSSGDCSNAAGAQNPAPRSLRRACKALPECEHSKYDRIVEQLRREDAHRGATEDRLLDGKTRVIEARRWHSSQKREKQDDVVKRICDEATKLERVLSHRATSKDWFDKYMGQLEEVGRNRLFTHKSITVAYVEGGEPRTVCVKIGLQNTRYYWGHKGGDYIFRYTTPPIASVGIPVAPAETGIRGGKHPVHHHLGHILPTEELQNLRYWGQVPRPAKEYLARLKLVIPSVLRVVVNTLGVVTRGSTSSPLPGLLALTQPDHRLSYGDLARLAHAWFSVSPGHAGHRGILLRRMRGNSRISELAHLIWMLQADIGQPGSIWLRELEPLIHILEDGTGWSFSKMAEQHDVATGRLAMSQLLRSKDVRHILVFEDEYIKVCLQSPICRWCRVSDTGSAARCYLYPRSQHALLAWAEHSS